MDGHVFLEYMSFRMTCPMRAYVFWEVILCIRKCFVGGHVLVECLSSGRYILQYIVFYLKTFFTGWHVLLKGMHSRRSVTRLEKTYWSTCFTGEHILQDDLSYRVAMFLK